jgi:hypothetical protein
LNVLWDEKISKRKVETYFVIFVFIIFVFVIFDFVIGFAWFAFSNAWSAFSVAWFAFYSDWFRIPHMPLAGSLKVLHAPAHRGGIRRASHTKIYNLETGE